MIFRPSQAEDIYAPAYKKTKLFLVSLFLFKKTNKQPSPTKKLINKQKNPPKQKKTPAKTKASKFSPSL